MVEPVTVGSLVAETLSVAAEAVSKSGAGEALKYRYKALRDKVSQWAPSDVAALEAKPGSIDRQAGIVKIVDAKPEADQTSLRALAEALVAKLKECAPRIGLDIGRLAALEVQLAAATAEQLEALLEFHRILRQLASRSNDGLENRSPTKLTRNPFVLLVRWYQREPGFEETVAKYASLLPILETSGLSYSKTALIGILALQARQLEIARTVHTDVRFLTTPSAALDPVTKGITYIVCLLVILSLIVAAVLYGVVCAERYYCKSRYSQHLCEPRNDTQYCSILFWMLWRYCKLTEQAKRFRQQTGKVQRLSIQVRLHSSYRWRRFALILAAVMDAKIISILDNRTQLFIVIGFLAGFSERFTQTLLQYAQERFLPKRGQQGQGSTQQIDQVSRLRRARFPPLIDQNDPRLVRAQ